MPCSCFDRRFVYDDFLGLLLLLDLSWVRFYYSGCRAILLLVLLVLLQLDDLVIGIG